jgi:hypothetical protein
LLTGIDRSFAGNAFAARPSLRTLSGHRHIVRVMVMAQRFTASKIFAATALLGLAVLTACERPPERGSPEDVAEQSERSSRNERELERDREREERRRERDQRRDEDRRVETRDVPIENFNAIDFRGTAELQVAIGTAPSVQMTGSARVLNSVKTKVHGETLEIEISKSRYWFTDSSKLKFVITVPSLKALESNGAGDIDITGLTGGEFELRVAGAHNVKAAGTLESLRVELEGAGNVDFANVPTADAKVEVSGAGNVEVNVSQSLRGEVNGVGAIRYAGNPQKVESELHGLGTIGAK